MSKLPRVIINLPKIVHNYQKINERCNRAGITLTGVIKGVAGDLNIIEALVEAGLRELGDSRLENLSRLPDFSATRKMLLRLPALSLLQETLEMADISLNSETDTLKSLDRLAKKHQIFLMVDLGDLREGVTEDRLPELGAVCRSLKNIEAIGLGANFSCFAGVIPTIAKLERLSVLAQFLRDEFRLPIRFVSGGNSSSLPLLYSGKMPKGINHLRIGEGILLGRETLFGKVLQDLYRDAFIIEAEIIQSQWKPALPDGEIGMDAFGRKPCLPALEAGVRLLLRLGHQDTPLDGLTPVDPDLTVMGGSSDYLVIASPKKLKVGETVQFLPNYWSLLGIMTSPYVEKTYTNN